MARSSRNKKKSTGISVDMQGVEKRKVVADGSYAVRVDEVTKETGQDSGKDYLSWVLEVTKGKFKGSKLWYNTSLQPNSLWNLRGVLEALGMEVPDGVMDIEFSELIDQEMGVTVERGSYDGKPKAEIVDVFPLDELKDRLNEEDDDEESDDDEDDKKSRRRRSKDDDEDEDEDEPKSKRRRKSDDDDEDSDDDEDEPKGRRRKKDDDDEDEDDKPARRGKKDEDDGDDDEDEKPARKKGKKKAGVPEGDVTGADEDGLAELIKEHELDVDLDDHSNLRKKRNAVISALEEAGLLESE